MDLEQGLGSDSQQNTSVEESMLQKNIFFKDNKTISFSKNNKTISFSIGFQVFAQLAGSQNQLVPLSHHFGRRTTSILRPASTMSCQALESWIFCLFDITSMCMLLINWRFPHRAPEDKRVSLTCHHFNLSTNCQR